MAKQQQTETLPRLQFPTFALPENARVLENRGRRSIAVMTAVLPVPTIAGDLNVKLTFWGELKTSVSGTEYSVSASFDRGVAAANQNTRDAILDHVERHAMRWAHWNQAYDAGHAMLTGKAITGRVKLARVDEPKPRLVDSRNIVLPTAEAQRRGRAAKQTASQEPAEAAQERAEA